MAPKYKQPYNAKELQALQGVTLPGKLKCCRCNNNLNVARFSEKQKNDARRSVLRDGRVTAAISCMPCTPGAQIVELECIMCRKTKGVEEFSKTQRREPDNAKCYKCIDEQVSLRPIDEDKYEDPDGAFIQDHSQGTYPDYFSSAKSIDDTASAYSSDTWNTSSARAGKQPASAASDGGVLIDNFSQSMQSMSLSGRSKVSSFFEGGIGGQRSESSFHTTNNQSHPGKSHTISSRVSGNSEASSTNVQGNNNSAKVGNSFKPMGDTIRESEALVNAWDSDEEDEDDDDDDEVDSDFEI